MRTDLAAVAAAIFLALVAALLRAPVGAAARQDGTPTTTYSCADGTPAAASSTMDHGAMGATPGSSMGDMAMGPPVTGMTTEMEFDQLYIDMMIPHHASIVAMAQAAQDRLEDNRLREIARRIADTQSAEIEELRGYREDLYGAPEPMAMDEQMMGTMQATMPGMGPMDEMAAQMDPAAQVAAICAADDADLAFIDLTIPHHEMAIAASEAALEQATRDEIRTFAERVIEDQRREIEELRGIRTELFGSATPERVGS